MLTFDNFYAFFKHFMRRLHMQLGYQLEDQFIYKKLDYSHPKFQLQQEIQKQISNIF